MDKEARGTPEEHAAHLRRFRARFYLFACFRLVPALFFLKTRLVRLDTCCSRFPKLCPPLFFAFDRSTYEARLADSGVNTFAEFTSARLSFGVKGKNRHFTNRARNRFGFDLGRITLDAGLDLDVNEPVATLNKNHPDRLPENLFGDF